MQKKFIALIVVLALFCSFALPTYAQYTASKHYRQCSWGLSVPEIRSWVAYGSSSYRCTVCGYVSNISINSVSGEFRQE